MKTAANLYKNIVITVYLAYLEHGNVLPTRKSERLFGVDCGVTPAFLRICDLLPKFAYLIFFTFHGLDPIVYVYIWFCSVFLMRGCGYLRLRCRGCRICAFPKINLGAKNQCFFASFMFWKK